jgi:hypothetical protein
LQAKTTKTRAWEELTFKLILKPDNKTPEGSINQLVVLFAPNTNNTDVFYFDEFTLEETPCKTVTTGVKEFGFDKNDVKVYPNPFNNHIQIDAPFVPSSISLFNLVGKEIVSVQNTDELNKQLPLLNAGTYMLRLENEGQYFYYKILKNNP